MGAAVGSPVVVVGRQTDLSGEDVSGRDGSDNFNGPLPTQLTGCDPTRMPPSGFGGRNGASAGRMQWAAVPSLFHRCGHSWMPRKRGPDLAGESVARHRGLLDNGSGLSARAWAAVIAAVGNGGVGTSIDVADYSANSRLDSSSSSDSHSYRRIQLLIVGHGTGSLRRQ